VFYAKEITIIERACAVYVMSLKTLTGLFIPSSSVILTLSISFFDAVTAVGESLGRVSLVCHVTVVTMGTKERVLVIVHGTRAARFH